MITSLRKSASVSQMAWLSFIALMWLDLSGCKSKPHGLKAPVSEPKPTVVLNQKPWIFAKKFVVMVRKSPKPDAERLGYLRGGAVLAIKKGVPITNEGCPRGWFELQTGGYLCAGKSLKQVEAEPLDVPKPPQVVTAQPRFDTPLPYTYGHTRRSATPLYRRIPTLAEYQAFESQKAQVIAAREFAAFMAEGGVPTAPSASAEAAATASQNSTEPSTPESAPEPSPLEQLGVPTYPVTPDESGAVTLKALKGKKKSILIRYLERGFLVSLDKEINTGPLHFWRTMSSGFVPFDSIFIIQGSPFHGTVYSLPSTQDAQPERVIGFILPTSDTINAFTREETRWVKSGTLDAGLGLAAFETINDHGKHWLRVKSDLWVDERALRFIAVETPSELIERMAATGQKWIDINLAKQTLIAFDKATPVFATLISSGKINEHNADQHHPTPAGEFSVTSKYVTHTMDGDHAVDGPYSIEDVPYVMYFQLAYAIHSAFWHNRFGHPKSHGCVNMAPKDAKWLFEWTDPPLPKGWHAVFPQKNAALTRVVIRGETPKH